MRTACGIELMHDVLAMIVYGPFRDPQDPGYVPGALPLGHPLQHFPFPARERRCRSPAFVFSCPCKGLTEVRQSVIHNDFGPAAETNTLFAREDSPELRRCMPSSIVRKADHVVVRRQLPQFFDKPVKCRHGMAVQACMNDFDQAVGVFFRQIVHIGFNTP